MIKSIFFDLDGTLLTSEKKVLAENKEAIKRARENGIEVCICSGRGQRAVRIYQEMSGAGRYIIATNGAEIYDTEKEEELFACPLEKDFCIELYQYVLEHNLFIRIDTKYARYINNMRYKVLDEIEMEENYKKFFDENKVLQISIGSAKSDEIDKVLEKIKDNKEVKIENRFLSGMLVDKLDIINIINSSCSKGNAILGLCKYLKINPEEVMAFGDDINDISMMKSVGHGVAMGNADTVIKDLAKEILPTTNNEPGIADLLNKLVEK